MSTTPQTNVTLGGIAELLRDSDDVVICGHVSPDGDCIGSQLTLWHALKALGKSVTCVLVKDDPVGSDIEFLPGIDQFVPATDFDGACSVFVGVDVPTRERIGEAACALLDKSDVSITIDHHAADARMCDFAYVDPDSASASILVWQVVKELVENPPSECALCAYTGLVTDTGGFRFQNSDSAAFEAAAELVSYDIEPSSVAVNVFQNRSLESMKLEAIVIERLHVDVERRFAISWLTQDDVDAVGAEKADVDPMIDTVRAIRGTRVACMLREQNGAVRGNLRAKDETDVSVIARELCGGGHKAAAGFTLEMPIAEAVAFMKSKLAEELS